MGRNTLLIQGHDSCRIYGARIVLDLSADGVEFLLLPTDFVAAKPSWAELPQEEKQLPTHARRIEKSIPGGTQSEQHH